MVNQQGENMLINPDHLYCYKKIEITHHNKLQFFLEKHSTKEGTWGSFQIHSGEIDFIFLDGEGKELTRHRINANHSSLHIPPALWHKIEPVTKNFTATLNFYCQAHRYFKKKHGVSDVHSDLYYVYNTYLKDTKNLNILDVGCGKGRNLLFLALLGHQLTGADMNEASIRLLNEIAQRENHLQIQTVLHDLHQPLCLEKDPYNLVMSLVSLQFLAPNRIPTLLTELQVMTANNGLHFLVFPIHAKPYSLPASFTYLAKTKALYHFYQDSGWSILEYKESVGQLHKLDDSGKPIQGLFGFLLAQKI